MLIKMLYLSPQELAASSQAQRYVPATLAGTNCVLPTQRVYELCTFIRKNIYYTVLADGCL